MDLIKTAASVALTGALTLGSGSVMADELFKLTVNPSATPDSPLVDMYFQGFHESAYLHGTGYAQDLSPQGPATVRRITDKLTVTVGDSSISITDKGLGVATITNGSTVTLTWDDATKQLTANSTTVDASGLWVKLQKEKGGTHDTYGWTHSFCTGIVGNEVCGAWSTSVLRSMTGLTLSTNSSPISIPTQFLTVDYSQANVMIYKTDTATLRLSTNYYLDCQDVTNAAWHQCPNITSMGWNSNYLIIK